MKSYLKSSILGWVISALLTGFTAQAAAPTGTFMIEFTDPAVRIWDPTGSYTESFGTVGDDWDVAYTLNVDGGGNLTGSGTFMIDSCALGACIALDGDFIITGKMSSGGDTVRIKMNFDMSGTGYFMGYDLFFYAKMSAKTELNTFSPTMVGSIGGNVKVVVPGEGKGGAKVPRSEFSASMPDGANGVWTLVLNLEQPVPEKPDQLAGNAMIALSSGLTLGLEAVKGKYKSKTDETTVAIKPSKEQVESKGVNLKLQSMTGAGFNLKTVKGKVAKQKIALEYSPLMLQPDGSRQLRAVSRSLTPVELPFPPVPLVPVP